MRLWDNAYRASGRQLATWIARFDTLGDGMCAHGPDCIIGTRWMTDALASLASFLVKALGESDREEIGQILRYNWPSPTSYDFPSTPRVLFLLGLKHDPDKTRWFSLEDEKASTSERMRHDKRWVEIPRWADGTAKSAYDLSRLKGEDDYGATRDFLTMWARYELIRQVVGTHRLSDKVYIEPPLELFQMGRDTPDFVHMRIFYQAFDAAETAVGIYRSLDFTTSAISAYRHNAGLNRSETTTESAAEDAA